MNKKKCIMLVICFLLCGLTACKQNDKVISNASETKKKTEVTIAAAASLTDAVNELKSIYEQSHKDIKIQPTYAGSGALQTQIEEGAPIDIFISAADKQMNALEEKNLIDKGSRVPLLKNEVVLIVPKKGNAVIKGFEDIANETVKKIAIADPASVPVGQYSEQIFTKLGNWDQVKSKIVISQDVRQSLDWVAQGEVDVGTVYQTDAYTEKEKVNIIATAPEGTHKPVNYPMALIEKSKNKKEAKDFYEFLKSDEANKVFEKFGFILAK